VYLIVGFFYGHRLPVRRFVPLLATLAVALLLFEAVAPTADYIVRESQSVGTMSDRLPLWGHLTRAVMDEEPVIGLGYYAASRVLAPRHNWALGNAHSVFFEVLVGGGLVSAILYLGLCLALIWYAARLLRLAGGHPHVVTVVGLLGIALVQGVTASEGINPGPLGFSFWSVTALLPAMCRAAEQARARQHAGPLPARRPVAAAHAIGGAASSWR
jgi:O-antigen ligase